MRLDLIAKLIADAGLGVIGGANASIFVHRMDATCLNGVMLRVPLDGIPVDTNLPDYYRHYIQVIVRAADQATGDTLIKNLMTTLTIYNCRLLNVDNSLGMVINHMFPKSLPRIYPTLDSMSTEWAVDFDTSYVMPS